ncbi:MAG: cell division protein ZapA [Clostridia bacterium]|nr:cell division protein ZapA [Clostridia bacterium]
MEMKQKYNLEIAGIQLSILSDEPEDFVKDLVTKLDTQITDLTVHNKRCAKIDAAILIALDALGEKIKLEKKLKNLEAQVALYEANLRRQRAESAPEEKPAEAESTKVSAEEKPEESEKPKKAPARKKALQQVPLEEPAPKVEEVPAEKKEAASPIRSDKIRQIESLLRTQGEDTPKSGKLAEIEQLLREGGKSSLSEALTEAADD